MKCYFIIGCILFLTFACTKKNEVVSQDDIQGKWHSYFDPNTIYFAGNNYRLNFVADSLQIDWGYFTDIVSIEDECYPNEYRNYIAGKYSISKFEFSLEGNFVDSTFANLNADTCRKMGSYIIQSEIYQIADTLVIELPTSIANDYKSKMKFLRD